jgi:hypothetical protein
MQVLVFKTNVQYTEAAGWLLGRLQTIQGVQRCNFDLADFDRILRIETNNLSPQVVATQLRSAGYFCEELAD